MFNIFTRILLHSASFVTRLILILILILNGGPARVARKPVVLLIPHFFQDQTGCIAPVALEPANFIIVVHDYYKMITRYVFILLCTTNNIKKWK
jgi:hypothetical protein